MNKKYKNINYYFMKKKYKKNNITKDNYKPNLLEPTKIELLLEGSLIVLASCFTYNLVMAFQV